MGLRTTERCTPGTERSALSGDVTVRHRTERALSEDELISIGNRKEPSKIKDKYCLCFQKLQKLPENRRAFYRE